MVEIASKSFQFQIYKDSASISMHNKDREDRDSHYPILHRLLNFMEGRGFDVGKDPDIEKNYKILTKDHWYGRKGYLEFKASRYPAGWKIEFFQNVVIENKAGGYYDFHKYEKMPYMIKLIFRNELRHIKEFLESLGCIDNTEKQYKLATDKIKFDYVKSCHYKQKSMDEFELSDLDGQTDKYSYNYQDRDKKIIHNGELKYFRHWDGRLSRGIVYRNLNNMWWVITNRFEIRNVADFELFDPTPEDFEVRRLARDKKPKEYIDRVKKISETSTRELLNELRRRKRGVRG